MEKLSVGHSNSASKTRLTTGLIAILLAAPVSIGGSGLASAQEQLRIAIGQPETHSHSYGYAAYVEYLEQNADLAPKIFQMSLLSLSEIPDGLRDGVAGMGNVVTAYKPAEYAETNLVADLSMLSTSGDTVPVPSAAMSGAVMEYVLFNCPDCQSEYTKQNQVFLGSASTTPYVLLCREPVTTLEQMEGKRFRAGAANFGRWAESVGGIKVSLPGNEIYDAMSQGVVDCAMLAASTLIEASLIEVTKAVHIGVPGGVFAGLANNAVNLDVWRGFTDEQRAEIIRGTAGFVADILTRQNELERESLDKAKAEGLEITQANDETLAAYAEFVEGDVDVIARQFEDQYKLQNVDAKIETITGLVDKWKGLVKDIGDDRDALEEVYWSEILSKLDPATYGMN